MVVRPEVGNNMQTKNNMIPLFIGILIIFLVFCLAMYSFVGLETLSKPYTEIMLENPSEAINLMLLSLVGIASIASIAKYFFERDIEEQDYFNKLIEYLK